jgi:hypothetical protein
LVYCCVRRGTTARGGNTPQVVHGTSSRPSAEASMCCGWNLSEWRIISPRAPANHRW